MANEELQRRSRRVRIFWIAAAVVIVIAIGLSMLPDAVDADIAKADRGDVRVEVVDEGRTRMHDIYIVSAPITGRVLRVEVEPGDEVAAGAILAHMSRAAAGFLDTRSDLQARAGVTAAEAQLRSADAELALAEREHKRNTELVAANLISKAATDQSEARLNAARAARDAARAEVQRARSAVLDPSRTERGIVNVTSPSPGRVLRVPQESEAVIQTGTPIVEVGDPRHVEVIAEFLSQDAVKMRAGAPAQIENWGGPPLPAVVDRVEPVAHTKISALGVEEQRTNVILQFKDKPADSLQAHDFRVDVRVVVGEAKNAIRVPLGALYRRGNGWALYKVVDGRAKLTEVQVAEADPHFRAVTAGVTEGDELIVFPGSSVSDGVRIKPRK
ncbi:MAG TPA: efflux RND transporter periplasmic adaptor subunit [Steroidobacteraceae bacterium]|jgi:HlyD family secretion protein|nr:efflux RND transporter periplasmic adaptor subunit [Steroidobacteraceae bacterium]